MGSGRVLIRVGLIIVFAVLLTASANAQPVRRIQGLIDPYSAPVLSSDDTMPTRSPVPPRTAYQPPTNPYTREPLIPRAKTRVVSGPQSKTRVITEGSRYGTKVNKQGDPITPDGTRRVLITGGIIINVASLDGTEQTEFATDEAVAWIRDSNGKESLDGLEIENDGKTKVEIYMSGDVVIRTMRGAGAKTVVQIVHAAEVYYDVNDNKAVALHADLEMAIPGAPDAFHLRGDEVRRLDLENWEILKSSSNASKLPSDPGLRLDSTRFTLSERRIERRNIFGIPFRDLTTGERVEYQEQIVTGYNVVTRVGGVPVFYLPRLRLDAADPLGPLQSIGFSQSRQFGSQFSSTWDMYELLALRPPPNHNWRLNLDYLTKRGPAAGTDYSYLVPGDTPGDPLIGAGLIRFYGISDDGFDLLGGYRGIGPMPPNLRGRAMWRHQQEITDEIYFQGQLALLSDQNFLEQYYKREFDFGPNQETFSYLTWNRRNFGASVLLEDRVGRNWVSETNWLPRVDGHVIGQTFLNDLFVYSARGSAAYAQSRPAEYNPFPLLSTDRRDDTGRFDVRQEVSMPLSLGPVKFAPYGVLELTEYTNDLNGNEVGRVYGGGGARASLPLSRLYSDVSSELLNLRGLYHKVVFGANYRYMRTNVPYNQLPLLDRLNDDAVDQAWRNITIFQSALVPGLNGVALQNSGGYSVFNPQLYAIRRGVENRIDTLDDLDVLQMDVRQRFQTKRGYPGMEHTVDFLSFDLSASYFPEANRDNVGHPFSFLEYGTIWNVGDRTALVSNGWFEPYEGGSRYWTAGVYLNRTDRTNLYLGYRQTDPLNSKAVTASVGYQLSHRYYATVGASYDFGIQAALSNSLMLTRTGTDMTVSIGFTYTAFVNSFGFQFMIIPNLAASTGRGRSSAFNSQAVGRR